jgi:hypothetical protein
MRHPTQETVTRDLTLEELDDQLAEQLPARELMCCSPCCCQPSICLTVSCCVVL